MTLGSIISIGFLLVLSALVLWNIRGHDKGPIDAERSDVNPVMEGATSHWPH